MLSYLIPIEKTDLLKKNLLIINNINDGFSSYSNGIISCIDNNISNYEKEKLFINFFLELYNYYPNFFTDYYVNTLDSNGLKIVCDNLPSEDLLHLNSNCNFSNNIYFKISNKNIIPYLTRLSTRELCFCTFFIDNGITIWGNYNFNFPIFFKNNSSIKSIENLLSSNKLKIDSLIVK